MSLTPTERACLEAFRQGADPVRTRDPGRMEDWLGFGLRLLLEAGAKIREGRAKIDEGEVELKSDGSPVTSIEEEIERLLVERLTVFTENIAMVGEETGGALPESGFAVAIDPIDGTWAFVNGTETYTTTLAFFHDREPFLGMVSNPATGEIGYTLNEEASRLLQLSLYGEADAACSLPRAGAEAAPPCLLVNVHPSSQGGALAAALHEAWSRGEVDMVRSPGGSPAWALLEAAKGDFVYVNQWTKRPADVYDLAAGVLLVRRAGGEVTDLEGQPIDMLRHQGPFVASIDQPSRKKVIELVGRVVSS